MKNLEKKRKAAAEILKGLKKLYPDDHCELDFKSPLERGLPDVGRKI